MKFLKSKNIQILRQLFIYTKGYRSLIILSAVIGIILAPLNALIPYLTNVMVDDHIMKMDITGLKKMSLLFLTVLILITILKYYFVILTNLLGQNVVRDLRVNVFKKINSFPLRYFDKTAVGTNTTRTINDLETVNTVFAEGLITILADVLALVFILVVMFYTSVKLTLICLVSFPLLIVASYVFKEKVKASFTRVRNEVAKLNAFLQENISGMKIIQLFRAEDRAKEKFKSINQEYTKANLDAIFYYAVFFPVVEIISAASLGFMVWWGAKGIIHHDVTIGQLVAFPMFLSRLFQPVRMLADKFNTLQMGLIAGDRIINLLNDPQSENDHGKIKATHLREDITVENVFFGYEKEHPVLKNISFHVPRGKFLAIVGPTGSGKTSLVNLLNRLYPIESGVIKIGDHHIDDYALNTLRSKISVVLQDVFLFSGTIYDNITLKNPNITHEDVIEATRKLDLEEFIQQFDGGYHFILQERGGNLSMGQRQLISFIRALVTRPDILILDEATSSIDPFTESMIQHAIEKLVDNKTSITIAHRLTTIRRADIIIYLKDGEIKEMDSLDNLLKNPNGLFRKLHDKQYGNLELKPVS